jgi:hypothetical protein
MQKCENIQTSINIFIANEVSKKLIFCTTLKQNKKKTISSISKRTSKVSKKPDANLTLINFYMVFSKIWKANTISKQNIGVKLHVYANCLNCISIAIKMIV